MDWRAYARAAARRNKIDEGIFEAQLGQESNFDPEAKSPAGALGIAQIMPATARGWGVDPMNPRASIDAAAKNMAGYQKQFGNIEDALRAYNAGPGAVQRSRGFSETNNYVKRILEAAHRTGKLPAVAATHAGKAPTGASPTVPNVGQPQMTNFFSQMANFPTVNVGGADQQSPQMQQLQETSRRNWEIMGQIQDQLMASVQRKYDIPTPHSPRQTASSRGQAASTNLPKGVTKFDNKPVASWIAPVLAYARAQGWKGAVNSGYRSFEDQTRIYNSGVRPAAKPGTSNHEGDEFPRGAVDVSEPEQLAEILRKSKYKNLLVWAGGKDPVHFSHPHNGSY
jgi:hypothetical protein